MGFLRLPVYLLIPLVLAAVACEGPTSTPAPTPVEVTVPAAMRGALPNSTFTPAPDVEATVIAAVRATGHGRAYSDPNTHSRAYLLRISS